MFPSKTEAVTKMVGPYTVDDSREFTLADLRKIGRAYRPDGTLVFVDYNGTEKTWYDQPIPITGKGPSDRTKTRRSVLKAMVTRRENKRKR